MYTTIYARNLPLTGVLDTKPYTDERHRAWIFRACGYGHGAEWWGEFVSTLRMYGYDYVLSIEHEDSLLSPEEGLTKAADFLNRIVPPRAARRAVVGVSAGIEQYATEPRPTVTGPITNCLRGLSSRIGRLPLPSKMNRPKCSLFLTFGAPDYLSTYLEFLYPQ